MLRVEEQDGENFERFAREFQAQVISRTVGTGQLGAALEDAFLQQADGLADQRVVLNARVLRERCGIGNLVGCTHGIASLMDERRLPSLSGVRPP